MQTCDRMHAYLATICRDLGADFVHVGGVSDHVHIVTTLPRTLSQAQFIEQIKKTSSKWIKTVDARLSRLFLAAWLWRIFSEPESARRCAAIHRWAKGAPSHSHLLGRISRVVAQGPRRFRRALCLGLRIAASIESRLQRLFRATTGYLGRCPRLNIDDAPLALIERLYNVRPTFLRNTSMMSWTSVMRRRNAAPKNPAPATAIVASSIANFWKNRMSDHASSHR